MTTPEENTSVEADAEAAAQEGARETDKLKAEMAMQTTLEQLAVDIENVLSAQMELLKTRATNAVDRITAELKKRPPAVQAAIVYLSELPEQLSR